MRQRTILGFLLATGVGFGWSALATPYCDSRVFGLTVDSVTIAGVAVATPPSGYFAVRSLGNGGAGSYEVIVFDPDTRVERNLGVSIQ